MFTENLSAFFADFGEPAILGGGTVQAIFDKAYLADFNIIEGSNPMALCIDTEIAGKVAHGTQITIRSVNYTIREAQPDGNGLTVLQLRAP